MHTIFSSSSPSIDMLSLFDIGGLKRGGGLIERGSYLKVLLDKGGLIVRGLNRAFTVLQFYNKVRILFYGYI